MFWLQLLTDRVKMKFSFIQNEIAGKVGWEYGTVRDFHRLVQHRLQHMEK